MSPLQCQRRAQRSHRLRCRHICRQRYRQRCRHRTCREMPTPVPSKDPTAAPSHVPSAEPSEATAHSAEWRAQPTFTYAVQQIPTADAFARSLRSSEMPTQCRRRAQRSHRHICRQRCLQGADTDAYTCAKQGPDSSAFARSFSGAE